ncbi:MAG TPA: hypothetical protein VND98_04975 [Solirubrobacterales bacterium]|nr:hypothetical protein [Solirubrobacterales bacterium]
MTRQARALFSALFASAVILAVAASPAAALETHDFSTSFGEQGSGDGQLSLAPANGEQSKSGIAVNDETGDVYVADSENHRVVEFSKTGNFIRAFGADVGGPGVNVCTSSCQAGTPGIAPGHFTKPSFIAVDNSPGGEGDVYVADSYENIVSKFTSSGVLIKSWGEEGQLIASTGTATGTMTEGSTTIASLTSTVGAFFVDEPITAPGIPSETTVTAVNSRSLEISQPATESATQTVSARATFGLSANYGIAGIAVDPAGHLWLYGAPPFYPYSEMFEFAPSSESLRAWPTNLENPSFGGIATDSAGNLYLPPTHYFGNVVQFTPAGVEVGTVDQAFPRTLLNGFTVDSATDELYTWAVGSPETNGLSSWAFLNHYPSSCDPGGECPPADTFGVGQISRIGSGLAVDPKTHTLYVADAGLSRIDVFTGPISAPESITEEATEVGLQKATLHGHLDPGVGPEVTSCAFQYVPAATFDQNTEETTSYPYGLNSAFSNLSSGGTIPCAGGPSFSAPASVHADLTGITAGAGYRYRLVLTNATGHRRFGETQSFTTPPDHSFVTTFAGFGANALSNPTALAIDERTHDVWVTDPANHRVEKFTPAGVFLLMIGKGVNLEKSGAAADLCTASEECQPGASASTPGAFVRPDFLAVDNTSGPSAGDLYVADGGDALITKFDSEGHRIASWGDAARPPNGQLNGSSDLNHAGPFELGNGNGVIFAGIAVDPAGNLWVGAQIPIGGEGGHLALFEFDQSGRSLFSEGAPGFFATGFAIDPADNLYFRRSFEVQRTSLSGSSPPQLFESRDPDTGEIIFPVGLAVDSAGEVYTDTGSLIYHYTPFNCAQVTKQCSAEDSFGSPQLEGARGLAIDSTNQDLFVANEAAGNVALFTGFAPDVTTGPIQSSGHTSATLTGKVDPIGRGDIESCRFQYVTQAAYEKTAFFDLSSGGTGPCDQSTPISSAEPVTATITGLQPETTYRYRLLAENSQETGHGEVLSFAPHAVLDLKTEAATEVENHSATLNGSFTADELKTEYFFQYGTTSGHYGHTTPEAEVSAAATGSQHLEAHLAGLVSGITYHYRLIARNSLGTTVGQDETLTTAQPPSIQSLSSSEVSATAATLETKVDPHGFKTECRFQYGTSVSYGQSAPCPQPLEGTAAQAVRVRVQGLTSGATYHFRLLAENKWGETTSEDQSFEFFPPACPNGAVRQQTSSVYLPDCRAYELVSPGNANGTLLFSGGPATGRATSPSRFAYVGNYGSPPEAAGTIGAAGDLYVSTRTDSGWVSHYIGLPGDQTGCVGSPPTDPSSHGAALNEIQNRVLTDPSMSRFLDFNDGTGISCIFGGNGTGDSNNTTDLPSNAPFLWGADGSLLAHLPTGLASLPGAEASLACSREDAQDVVAHCAGEVTASPDLTHLFFSSNNFSFAEGGITGAPGSAYDDNLTTGTIELISRLPNGEPIPQDPAFANMPPNNGCAHGGDCPGGHEEFLRFPAVSADGSHVLISTATVATSPCGKSTGTPPDGCLRFADTPIHLYMRLAGVTKAISISELTGENVPAHFLGMTSDGSEVFFTAAQHLTAEDPDHGGSSLYMWSEHGEAEGRPLTLISRANPGGVTGAGDTAECTASWTQQCGIVPYSDRTYTEFSAGNLGGNGLSDTAIASRSGEIYFYSPEQLDGDRGVPGLQNLYLYRGGRLHFVAAFEPGEYCEHGPGGLKICTEGPIARFQVTPDGAHMAFVTAARLTSYDNADHLEMYSYTPSTEALVCDSCNPSGQPATANVFASQDGLFQTEDGRTFFATAESLVPTDTNQATDVYEFVAGRPHLLTPGTGIVSRPTLTLTSYYEIPGLIGVSADGTDVYFSTYDTLLAEDHNGNFLKFYDARTNGGFGQHPPVQPCAAAEECHGPGTEAPTPRTRGTAAGLTGGNVTLHRHHNKRHRKTAKDKRHHKRHHKRHANPRRRAAR